MIYLLVNDLFCVIDKRHLQLIGFETHIELASFNFELETFALILMHFINLKINNLYQGLSQS